jgi:CO/xanthine dehydrogenase Mo-binding subunit
MSTTPYRVIGTASPRADAVEKVTGRARYTADTTLPGTLWMKALRSPYAHARIVSIDTAAARALAGVHAVLTGADVAGVRFGRRLRDVPVLAQDVVRFVGERVAAVAAESAAIAEAACALIEVAYEELPAVLDPQAALAADAPALHPDVNTYAGLPRPVEGHLNGFVRDTWGKGDPERGFAEAEVIVEGTYRTQRAHQGYMETHGCLVWADPDGHVDVWAPNKAPHRLKHDVAAALGMEEARVVVHHSAIGGDFGGKGSPMDVPACYFLSRATGRPVRAGMTYAEELAAGNPRHASVARLRTGLKRDGTLVAHEARILFDSGAYGGFKPVPGVNLPGAAHAAGPYAIPHAFIEAVHVYTNAVPGGFYRGPGAVQANFAIESHMDVIAARLGMDPIALRRRNLIAPGQMTAIGHEAPEMNPVGTLDAALRTAGWDAPKPVGVGRGISLAYKGQGEGVSSAGVELRIDGSVVLHTSVFEQGTGSYTAFAQMVAEELGLRPDEVAVEPWDTDVAPFDTGIGASRVTRVTTPAVHQAVGEAKAALITLAVSALGWPRDAVRVAGRDLVHTGTGARCPWVSLLAPTGEAIITQATSTVREEAPVASFMAAIAEVSVDPETGAVKLLSVTSAHDVGQVLNPIGHQGQVNGGIMQAIGHSLMEEVGVGEDGRVDVASLADYKLPTFADVPELRTALVESESGLGPYRTKGIGEYAIEALAAAVANAVADACGARVTSLPVTAEKVYRALHQEG